MFKRNLTIHCVCPDCNGYFGRELELFLATDSVESVLRVQHGLAQAGRSQQFKNQRLVVRVEAPGDWFGARIQISHSETAPKLRGDPLPQVAFRHEGTAEWKWILESELSETVVKPYQKDAHIKIVGPSSDETLMNRLLEKLRSLGVTFHEKGPLNQPVHGSGLVPTLSQTSFDDVLLRAIGKIALNYLAHAQGPEFTLRPDFDEIRGYIRQGTSPSYRPSIVVSNRPILFDDDMDHRQTNGHLIVLDWNNAREGIVVNLSLFNHLTYYVLMCPRLTGLWFPIRKGHHFDIDSLTVTELGSFPLTVKRHGLR